MLVWQVYNEDFNGKKIKVMNVFSHYGFSEDCKKHARKFKDDKERFLEEVRRSLMYFFWSKCEYEIILSGWPSGPDFHEEKIDVYEQVILNWHVFSEYVWENRKEFLKRKKKEPIVDHGGTE